MKKVVFLISGGHISDLAFLKSRLSAFEQPEVICADGGARHAYVLGLIPKAIIGDMDSLDPDIEKYFEALGSNIMKYPKDKDKTDTKLALEYSFEMSPDEVWIFGALGGRIDHTLANISLLVAGAEKGIDVKLVDEWCEVFLIAREAVIEGKAGQTISLLPFSQTVTGIDLEGFAYPLLNGTMEIANPYGISNKLLASRGVISIKSGHLLVVRYFKPGLFPQGDL